MRNSLLTRSGLFLLHRRLCTANNSVNPRVFFDIAFPPSKKRHRVIIELRSDLCPQASASFQRLCTGELGFSYKGANFNVILRRVACWGGGDLSEEQKDVAGFLVPMDFPGENGKITHDRAGVVSLSSAGLDKKTTNFLITFTAAKFLDDNNLAVGQVVEGLNVLAAIEKRAASSHGGPYQVVTIADCGLSKDGE